MISKVQESLLKRYSLDFPGSPVIDSPLANEGGVGSTPDPGRFHMHWALSQRTATTEACVP